MYLFATTYIAFLRVLHVSCLGYIPGAKGGDTAKLNSHMYIMLSLSYTAS